ncbi:exodeoxyribonuclease V subunit gamma [Paraburkholderia megapolitana]|uniref:RecBCD enzyme subunit RecC n=1 Tax=Paraburkholderia megapolitana TaxID=420953 RepID=A0A1I3R4L7_9BURK|nr:exodeoxyribonuclease V subunit gamma [Paraburkholderia megapolitana]QDQ83684.1 exodeoxyribonuclease V subunit gamma [Paraburkholderia megapolitana]SFJ41055.1 DNA helicase/exodeoxyribonuclease V, gamma subunit [Paraburkholderia megapolitana]
MLQLFYSNRYETLVAALLADMAETDAASDPWTPRPVIVPSAAVRRRLELDIAAQRGVCANVDFRYLAQWLWAQIDGVIPVPPHSPFAPDRLVWRCYRQLGRTAEAPSHAPWNASPRLRAYLEAADPSMRYELSQRVATVLDHYLTYRPEWLLQWQKGGSIFAGPEAGETGPRLIGASAAAREDERWQAALWRALLAEVADEMADGQKREPGGRKHAGHSPAAATPPAYRFLDEVGTLDLDAISRAGWPAAVHVFALPTMPPLHIELLRALSRWVDVRLYALNPCREFWFDIVSERRVEALDAAGQLDYQEVGHPLLAEWGRQTQAQLHMLHELTESAASSEASLYVGNPAPTWLAAVQNAILALEPESGDSAAPEAHGIEVHVCHSLSRQLEVLHDRLLGWFDEFDDLQPSDVLVACADLATAGPLIDAVFGTAPAGSHESSLRRIPYRITGLPPTQANPVARVLLDWLALPERNVGAPELIEWLRVDAVAARYGIDAAALETAQEWLAAAGARRGLAPVEPTEPVNAAIPVARHTFADALTRLFLGYAMPDHGEPVDAWLPVEGAGGPDAELLGRLARFVDHLDSFARRCATEQTPAEWTQLLLDTLAQCFDTGVAFADALADVRGAIDAIGDAMQSGALDVPLPASVVRTALAAALDDPARGGVPWGSVTFSSLTSLRGLPYRIVCLLGMDDGVLPSLARADEFDLMAAFGKPGDRQRRDDERNLFLDLLLATRDRLLIAYTGRSIRDNAPLPPAALVDELLDHLARVSAGEDALPAQLDAARRTFIVEHPLQPFAADYFAVHDGDTPLFTYDPERAELAALLSGPPRAANQPFFSAPLPAEPADPVPFDTFQRFWRHPARALLRDRLGIVLTDTQGELLDIEPFELDYAGRDALADRLLPALLDAGTGDAALGRIRRIAQASPELPGGATGEVWQARELGALRQLADNVRQAVAGGVDRLQFALDLAPRWPDTEGIELFGPYDDELRQTAEAPLQLHGTLNLVTETGQVMFRYAKPTARDYLSAWLAHLVYCAAQPDGPRRTVWHGSGDTFEFAPVAAPLELLAPLAALFRAGRSLPLRFFPKSAWAKVNESDSAAQNAWISDRVRGESDDPALRIAWRGTPLTLDEPFGTLATIVFAPLREHLRSRS